MKYCIYLFLFVSLIVFGCVDDESQLLPEPVPAPSPTPTPSPVPVPSPTPNLTPVPSPSPSPTPAPSPATGIPSAASVRCTDSDGSDYPFRLGMVTVEYAEDSSGVYKTYGTWSDSCADSSTVIEVFCANDKPDRYDTKTVSCKVGETCSEGTCRSSSLSSTCTDSDEGKNYNVKGTTKKGTENREDWCFTSDPNIVNEYFCQSKDTIGSESYTCPNTCSDGACTTGSIPTPNSGCNSNQDCGSKSICVDGVCQDVDCRTDSDCSGCRRCSYNSCVKCPQGPYGCTC